MDGWTFPWQLREPPQASSAALRQRFEVPDWPPHASIHELPSARTDAEAHRSDGSGSSNWTRAQGPVVSPHLHSLGKGQGFTANAQSECTTTIWHVRTSLVGNTVPAGCGGSQGDEGR